MNQVLVDLSIRNYAVIKEVDLSFGPGLNVLTGETGAGKSVIIGAIALLLGSRASVDLIRTGCSSLLVEGSFQLPPSIPLREFLEEQGLAGDSDELIISREVTRNGRNRCRINDRMVNVSVLEAVAVTWWICAGSMSISLCCVPHAHHAGRRIWRKRLQAVRRTVSQGYRTVRRLETELAELVEQSREAARKIDLLQFQIGEIEEAKLVPGEEEELTARRKVLANQQTLQQHSLASYKLLYEGEEYRPAVIDLLGEALANLQEVVKTDDRLAETLGLLESAMVEIQEVSGAVRDYLDQLEADPAELDQVERRLTDIGRLKRKYGDSVEEILSYCSQLRKDLDQITGADEQMAALQRELEREKQDLKTAAQELTRLRAEVSRVIEAGVAERLKKLNMKDPRFVVRVVPVAGEAAVDCAGLKVGPDGAERLEFLISTNPGEEPSP